ncbi:Uncharacterised protein [Actinomyces bovis]|uniref:Uncharacterized protein n=1 Tax=Actinomyces bovis TaxID=1658 RepID=A0ABY1VRV6_9ACTO|nr:hypothetical protein [Actinomyces bovis]SPT53773.1 Uncharacterised protein [Actinomyces bovis]VEG53118.1 Uncharacterised protein [Actinomyces israelii]
MGGRTEYRVVTFCTTPEHIFGAGIPGTAAASTVDFAGSVPDLAENMDGWEAVSHQVIPAEDRVFLSILLRTSLDVPDTLTGDASSGGGLAQP